MREWNSISGRMEMGKLIAIIAVAGLVAGAGAYGLVYHTNTTCPNHVDPADCPVVKVGGCCDAVSPAACPESVPAYACCADTGSVAHAAGGKDAAAAAVAGPAALFTSTTKVKKKACCCCDEEPTALTAVVGVAAVAK